eukprot:NODE_209_length_12852_cov_0.583863.p3 type:complete len:282 gc:universal NODE_209_length_12852_cov_0.583863:3736-4581(+)
MAPLAFKELLLEYMNGLCEQGLIPDHMRYNLTIPLPKNPNFTDFDDMKKQRPINLFDHIKKLMEAFILPTINPHLQTSNKFVICKVDISSAFDSVQFPPLQQFIIELAIQQNIKQILLNLVCSQHLALLIGDLTSGFKAINKGQPQGSKISPGLFYRLLDILFLGFEYFHILFADDCLIVCKPGELNEAIADIKKRIARLGLTLNEAKTETLGERYSIWLVIKINKFGLSREMQLEYNINKAKRKLGKLTKFGVFKNSFKYSHLLRSIGIALNRYFFITCC